MSKKKILSKRSQKILTNREEKNEIEVTQTLKAEIKFRNKGFNFSEKQQKILAAMLAKANIVVLSGVAGTSKTFMAVYGAVQILKEDPSKRIIYIRSVVESAAKTIGYLPGEKEDKFEPYERPFRDKLEEIVTADTVSNLKTEGKYEASPINYLRGNQFDNSIIIIDEAQNLNRKEFLTTLTRIGKNSQIFVCGDIQQSDIKDSYLPDIVKIFSTEESINNGIFSFSFSEEDIVRNELIKYLVRVL